MTGRDPRLDERVTSLTDQHPVASLALSDLMDLNAGNDEAPLISFAQIARVIRRRKGTILIVAFLGAVAGLLVQLPKTPIYRSAVSVEVQQQNDEFFYNKDVSPSASQSGTYPDIEMATQVRILEGHALQNRVIQKLNADDSLPTSAPEDRFAAWRTALHLPARHRMTREALLLQTAGTVHVAQQKQTRIIEISADSPEPRIAAAFANAMASEYIDATLETRWKSAKRTGEWLTTELDDMKIKLQRSEEELQRYAAAISLVPGDKEKDSLAGEKLRQLQTQLLSAQSDLAEKQARYELAMTSSPDSLGQVLDDPSLRGLDGKLSDLRREMAELSSTLTPSHYKVQKVQAQITEMEADRAKTRSRIVERIHSDFEEASHRAGLLSSALSGQSAVVTDQSGKVIHYDILQREVDSNRQLYESLLQKVKEASLSSALRASNIQVVDAAEASSAPVSPSLSFGALIGLASGLCLGAGLVVMADRNNPRIELPGEAALYLRVPELGIIPSYSMRQHPGARRTSPPPANFEGSSQIPRLTPAKPVAFTEAFRILLTSLLFLGRRRPMQVIVVTSPGPSEGKSTTVSNLAAAYAETGRSVLIIDCDMARPRQHQIHSVASDFGLAALLSERDPLDSRTVMLAVRHSDTAGVNVIPLGTRVPESSASLLHSKRLPELLDLARERFDVVLIDTPPVLYMADSRIVGSVADGVIMVVRARQTSRDSAVKAVQQLIADRLPVLGVALNDWDPKLAGYYYGYDYDYSKYYSLKQG